MKLYRSSISEYFNTAHVKFVFNTVALVSFCIVAASVHSRAEVGGKLNNEIIENCVVLTGNNNIQILDCIGRFSRPCRTRPDNSHPDSQEECLEHEFVLWDQLMRRSLKSLKNTIPAEQARVKVQKSHDLWKAYHEVECRLPYSLLPRDFTAKEFGLNCSIQLTARRVADLIKIQRVMNKFK